MYLVSGDTVVVENMSNILARVAVNVNRSCQEDSRELCIGLNAELSTQGLCSACFCLYDAFKLRLERVFTPYLEDILNAVERVSGFSRSALQGTYRVGGTLCNGDYTLLFTGCECFSAVDKLYEFCDEIAKLAIKFNSENIGSTLAVINPVIIEALNRMITIIAIASNAQYEVQVRCHLIDVLIGTIGQLG